ncbi:MAG: ribosome biogenesis GTPase YlqF [Clostridia bacterium]|nr:ribosome biogenesis GTPase YlqF [Clostridia bacterium]
MVINWYPGHMAKAKRLLSDQLGRCDVVIELCDARLPYSSRNPDLIRMIGNKKRILLLNKADLADANITHAWVERFRSQGVIVSTCTASKGSNKEVLRLIDDTAKEAVERAAQKGVRKTVRVMVAGVPNVGKSTLINALHGSGIAKTGDRPGVTKANQWVTITPYLQLLDSPGLLWPRLDDQVAAKRLCYIGSVKDDVVDLPMLAISLLEELLAIRPEPVMERFRFNDASLTGEALLEAVCKGRGFLLKGGVCDYDRCCQVVLDEFRAGKCGRFSLETPPRKIALTSKTAPEENRDEQT